MKDLDFEIARLNQRQIENQAIVNEITPIVERISNFDATQTILDHAAEGSGLWNKTIFRMSDFIERRRNFWVTKIETITPDEIKLSGYSLNRSVLTEFADQNKASLLKSINFEPLREKSAFAYILNLKLMKDPLTTK